jgi:hypothetical protein
MGGYQAGKTFLVELEDSPPVPARSPAGSVHGGRTQAVFQRSRNPGPGEGSAALAACPGAARPRASSRGRTREAAIRPNSRSLNQSPVANPVITQRSWQDAPGLSPRPAPRGG